MLSRMVTLSMSGMCSMKCSACIADGGSTLFFSQITMLVGVWMFASSISPGSSTAFTSNCG